MNLYIRSHTKTHTVENLRTVYALQDGVTRLEDKINVTGGKSLGGTGLADILEFFRGISSFAEVRDTPKLVILSGSTYIKIQDPYISVGEISADTVDTESRPGREIWFNDRNSRDLPPDSNYVFTLPGHIPGTLVTLAFNLNPDLLKVVNDAGN